MPAAASWCQLTFFVKHRNRGSAVAWVRAQHPNLDPALQTFDEHDTPVGGLRLAACYLPACWPGSGKTAAGGNSRAQPCSRLAACLLAATAASTSCCSCGAALRLRLLMTRSEEGPPTRRSVS